MDREPASAGALPDAGALALGIAELTPQASAGERAGPPGAGPASPSAVPEWRGTLGEAIRLVASQPGVVGFVSGDPARQSLQRMQTGEGLVRIVETAQTRLVPGAESPRVYAVRPDGTIHNTVTGRDEYVPVSRTPGPAGDPRGGTAPAIGHRDVEKLAQVAERASGGPVVLGALPTELREAVCATVGAGGPDADLDRCLTAVQNRSAARGTLDHGQPNRITEAQAKGLVQEARDDEARWLENRRTWGGRAENWATELQRETGAVKDLADGLTWLGIGAAAHVQPLPRPPAPLAGESSPAISRGGHGTWSRRTFDPDAAGGPIRSLRTDGVRVTERGVDVVEGHLARFGPDAANEGMVLRLREIAGGRMAPEPVDLHFYAHELREFARYRQLGFRAGAGGNYELWNNAHTATLADYRLESHVGFLYHPSVLR